MSTHVETTPSLMEQIEHLEVLVHNMKSVAIAAGNEAHIASAILAKEQEISNCLGGIKHAAEKEGTAMWRELVSLLRNEDDLPIETLWRNFHDTLILLEGTSAQLRKCIFFNYINEWNKQTLLHEVCSKNPPANVVKVLLDIIPGEYNYHHYKYQPSKQFFNHLALDKDNRPPLHMVLQNGGSIDVVKLLINADHEKATLKMTKDEDSVCQDSVYHMLIAKRDNYEPDTFSEILRYLSCISTDCLRESGLLNQAKLHDNKVPVLLLIQSFINKDGMTGQDIWRHRDFIFVLKATCYHYKMSRMQKKGVARDNDIDNICQEIEEISLSEAFVVCAPCFTKKVVNKMLNELLATDCQFLLKKDSSGQYPFHQLILTRDYENPSYFMDTITTDRKNDIYDLTMQLILKHVPQCAQQYNDEGLLPLHIAADAQRFVVRGDKRFNLVSMIWKSYPDAADMVDKHTGLPPFALAARGKDEADSSGEDKKKNKEPTVVTTLRSMEEFLDRISQKRDDLSSSFFLLRQHPEILSEYNIVGGVEQPCSSKDSIPLAKRPRKGM